MLEGSADRSLVAWPVAGARDRRQNRQRMMESPGERPSTETRTTYADRTRDAAPVAVAFFVALTAIDPFGTRGQSHVVARLSEIALALWLAALIIVVSTALLPSADRGSHYRELATVVSGVAALVLTAIALGLSWAGLGTDSDHLQLSLTPSSRAAIDRLCGTRNKPLAGKMPTGQLGGAFAVFTLDRNLSGRCDDIRIPVAAILAAREIH